MIGNSAASAVLSTSLQELLARLPGVRDGLVEDIHQARVEMRRVREVLSVARGEFKAEELGAIAKQLKRAGRALGRARDADIGCELVLRLEERLPLALHALGHLRGLVAVERQKARRRAVKRLDALDIASLPKTLAHARRDGVGGLSARRAFRWALRQQIASRAKDLIAAVDHAGGVYFRNRVHRVRVAAKRLRYTLELADRTGIWVAVDAMKLLKKVQNLLGEAHDREILLERIGDLAESGLPINADEVETIRQINRVETLARHAKYIKLRQDVFEVCSDCQPATATSRVAIGALAAGIAIPSLLLLGHQWQTRRLPAPAHTRTA
jgi:triphosphatase